MIAGEGSFTVKKKYVFIAILGMVLFFFVPIVLVMIPFGTDEDKAFLSIRKGENAAETVEEAAATAEKASEADAKPMTVPVFRSETETVEKVDLEEYVAGVVASEMPAEFEMEALKAQALTARTYVAKQINSPADINLPDGALVTDTPMHQVFQSQEELRDKWGDDFEWKMEKIHKAVQATKGQVLTYEGKPITAAFFSTSNGYTENAEDYWQNPVPYLQSVKSPWDKTSPRYENEQRIPVEEVERLLGVTIGGGETGEITERTEGGRVAAVKLGGKTFHGREVRETLELDSSDFQIGRDGNNLVFRTKGWGHGVGMSQYGAEGMAKEGKNYKEILHHYYKGVDIANLTNT
ncbi:stage II sporulation protein D [Bacillus piscicola]|uniref:stage II sporulation protein D n=1 Tax=Bacillus piscicola TaxID=1632684 RepID=UPI001F0937C6|nr:stage II sporulation protein D [Bacillus piscicola]